MPSLGFPELMIILVIALVIFGPGKLPSLGKSVGETIKEFKKASSELMGNSKTEDKTEDVTTENVNTKDVNTEDADTKEFKTEDAKKETKKKIKS